MPQISREGLRKIVALACDPFYSDRKIEAIKRLRELTGFSLLDSKNLVEAEFEFRNPSRVDPVMNYIDRGLISS